MPSKSRENNFNFIRLCAAFLVMAGHMGAIMGEPVPGAGSQQLQNIGVQILFLISGYLVANSWRRDPHAGRFLLRRFLRLWPPYAVMVLLMCFVVGPYLSELGKQGYYDSWWRAYLDNLRFYTVYAQPGVFANNPLPLTTNGSVWTMPVEALTYLLMPLLMLLLSVGGRKRYSFRAMAILTAIVCIPDLVFGWNKSLRVVFYGTNWAAAYTLIAYYFIGVLCSFEEMRPLFQLQAAPVAVLLMLLTTVFRYPHTQEAVWLITLPYLVFSFALVERPLFAKLGSKHELSYGIYLYGFFFQQLVVLWDQQYQLNLSYMSCLGISLGLTAIAAYLNCLLVEEPVLRLSRKLTAARK